MIERNQVYRCAICGNIVEVRHAGGGTLVCCGQDMNLQSENTVDASLEKHVPVMEQEGSIVKVKVGSVEHPMEEAHYIMWIEVMTDDSKLYIKYLKPGDKPEAEFIVAGVVTTVRAYCNLHGLWKR